MTQGKIYKRFRYVAAKCIFDHQDQKGADSIIFKVDEVLFGRQMNWIADQINEQWVLGGIEKDPFPEQNRKMFFCKIPNGNAETLIAAVEPWIKPGSIIYTNMWR
ncbi:MAG: hypothetical protein EZS28_009711 [Streblomastix strix]|uniref:ISXO2-like transposase domain-containing protein n=1 Tax=Streblomastix strix TaxID=222440 RepID=A0A5J4WI66_9EUKA|nr:MAG: hypothetical protein EZS28_009711 [Streblomastix strix]